MGDKTFNIQHIGREGISGGKGIDSLRRGWRGNEEIFMDKIGDATHNSRK
jgi:hypothetical protein